VERSPNRHHRPNRSLFRGLPLDFNVESSPSRRAFPKPTTAAQVTGGLGTDHRWKWLGIGKYPRISRGSRSGAP